jgi:flavin reductase (DIM6/NTAB) family NADH-FMN oxidoreductase RutF
VLHGDTAGWLACRLYREVEAGDHVVVIGLVLEGGVGPEERVLGYHRRRFFAVPAHQASLIRDAA